MLTENVTYLETLHPEEGYKALKKDEHEYAGKWDAVFAEAIPVREGDSSTVEEVQMDVESNDNKANNPNPNQEKSKPEESNSCHKFNCVVIIVGWSLLIGAMCTAWGLELTNSVVFLVAVGFNWVAEKFGSIGGPVVLLQGIFNLIASVLLFVDSLLLTIGTFVTELLGSIAFLVCTLFGGLTAGREWQQAIRRDCHLTRWAFRGFHEGWECQRGSPCGSSRQPEQGGNNNETNSALEQAHNQTKESDDSTIVVKMEDVKIVDDDEEDQSNVKAAQ